MAAPGEPRAAEAKEKGERVTVKVCPSLSHSTEGGIGRAAMREATAAVP